MQAIKLSEQAQSYLGKQSEAMELKAYRLRVKAQKIAKKEARWLRDDTLPATPTDRCTLEQLSQNTLVIERIAPYRTGTLVKFGFLIKHGKCPIIRWNDSLNSTSFAIPEHLALQKEQLSLF